MIDHLIRYILNSVDCIVVWALLESVTTQGRKRLLPYYSSETELSPYFDFAILYSEAVLSNIIWRTAYARVMLLGKLFWHMIQMT